MQMRAQLFLQSRAVRRWVPLPLSIFIHLGLIAALIFGFHNYHDGTASTERAMVPDAVLVQGAKVGGVKQPVAKNSSRPPPMRSLVAPEPTETEPAAAAAIPMPILPPSPDAGSIGVTPMIGLPAAAPAAPIGIASAPAPAAHFMGISGDAVRVVFVCDASGSMMDRLPILEARLHNAIDQLQPIQWFNVIFFQESTALAANPGGLLQALPANRDRIAKSLSNISAHGNSNPLAAISLAFSEHPQVIYLLTDGDFEDVADSVTDQKILERIAQLNSAGDVCVNTILFISNAGDLQQEDARAGRAVLQKIAAENRGTFKVVVAE